MRTRNSESELPYPVRRAILAIEPRLRAELTEAIRRKMNQQGCNLTAEDISECVFTVVFGEQRTHDDEHMEAICKDAFDKDKWMPFEDYVNELRARASRSGSL